MKVLNKPSKPPRIISLLSSRSISQIFACQMDEFFEISNSDIFLPFSEIIRSFPDLENPIISILLLLLTSPISIPRIDSSKWESHPPLRLTVLHLLYSQKIAKEVIIWNKYYFK
ncbi:MAG: hypothetical protein ACFFE5_14300 [Candidatus Thorarchaeota archaeon]